MRETYFYGKSLNQLCQMGSQHFTYQTTWGKPRILIRTYQRGFYAFSSQADKIPGQPANLYKVPGVENLSDASISLNIAIKNVRAKEKAASAIIIVEILSDILLRHKSITTRRWLLDFIGKRKTEGFTLIATLNPLETTMEEIQTTIDSFDGVIEIYEKALAQRARRFLIVKKMYGRRYSENEVLLDKDKLFGRSEKEEEQKTDGPHTCGNCGAKLVQNAKFCKECGTTVDSK